MTTGQVAATAVMRAKSYKALPKALKNKQPGIHVTSYKYNKKTKSGYQLGWARTSKTETDDHGNKIRINTYMASSMRGKGKTAVQAVTWQFTFGKEKANTKVLIQKADQATKILAKHYKI